MLGQNNSKKKIRFSPFLLFFSLFLGFLGNTSKGQGRASEGWRLIFHFLPPFHLQKDTMRHRDTFMLVGFAGASGFSQGSTGSGSGVATDLLFGDVRAAVAVTGTEVWLWRYFGKGMGEAEVMANLEAEGVVNLKSAESAAAAVGSSRFWSNITGEISASVKRSAAATTSRKYGKIGGKVGGQFGGIEFEFDLRAGRGKGRYPDREKKWIPFKSACTNLFWKMHTVKFYIMVNANGGVFSLADCRAYFHGKVRSSQNLLRCPH
jgi:hypothetical protein